ncbi:MAG: phosphoribosyltransferase [Candidatus Hermodarchaeota archaeon]
MKFEKYESRFQAGQILAEYILKRSTDLKSKLDNFINRFFVFAIPNGGVPVAEGFCDKLNLNYDIIIVRKIKIPFNTEAGFGSITTDGTILINEPLLNSLNLSNFQLEKSIESTKNEIKERTNFYNKGPKLHETYRKLIENQYIFLMDDGLASGFTMLAAIQMVNKYNPAKTYIAVPTAPLHTISRVQREVSEVFCPNSRNTMWFAVADAYQHWYDVPESEVLETIKKSKFYFDNFTK